MKTAKSKIWKIGKENSKTKIPSVRGVAMQNAKIDFIVGVYKSSKHYALESKTQNGENCKYMKH